MILSETVTVSVSGSTYSKTIKFSLVNS